MNLSFDQVVSHLKKVRADHGDASFQQALKGLFRMLLQKPGADDYIQRLLTEFSCPVSLEDLKAEVKASLPRGKEPTAVAVEYIRQAIEQQMPHCKTQAHFDLVLQSWEALKVFLEAAYALDRESMELARTGLNRLLDLAPQVALAHARLQETPEVTTNQDYLKPPREMTESHEQQRMLAELRDIDDRARLNAWYAQAKPALDQIVTPFLRDELLDAIRERKRALSN